LDRTVIIVFVGHNIGKGIRTSGYQRETRGTCSHGGGGEDGRGTSEDR